MEDLFLEELVLGDGSRTKGCVRIGDFERKGKECWRVRNRRCWQLEAVVTGEGVRVGCRKWQDFSGTESLKFPSHFSLALGKNPIVYTFRSQNFG